MRFEFEVASHFKIRTRGSETAIGSDWFELETFWAVECLLQDLLRKKIFDLGKCLLTQFGSELQIGQTRSLNESNEHDASSLLWPKLLVFLLDTTDSSMGRSWDCVRVL